MGIKSLPKYAALAMAFGLALTAQGQQNGLPAIAPNAVHTIKGLDAEQMYAEDNSRKKPYHPENVGRLLAVNLTPYNSGEWITTDKGSVWRLKVKLDGAKAITLLGKMENMPNGASLIVYNSNTQAAKNTYKASDFNTQNIISTTPVAGQEAVIEYFVPNGISNTAHLIIERLCYIYRYTDPNETQTDGFGNASSCNVNVNCNEGDNWRNQRNSVVRILAYTDFNTQWCTGTMVNNTSQKIKPYLLTAMHCGLGFNDSLSNDTMFKYWLFTFNYQAPSCANPMSEGNLADNKITGSKVLAHTEDKGGELGSDFLLLELTQPIPPSYGVYYSGWSLDTTEDYTDSAVSIHHPKYDIKKISTSTWPLKKGAPYPTSPDNTHWEVLWSATANGHGVTEPGSSGSALFNKKGYLIGTLTGGSASCTKLNGTDFYGRLDWHWDRNGSTPRSRLKDWLDSTNTGATSVSGAYLYPESIGETVEKDKLTLYPNPANNWLRISGGEFDNATITTVLGQQLQTIALQNGWLHIETLPAGVYIVSVNNGKTTYTGRFIKQ